MSLRDAIQEWRQPDGLIVPKSEHVGMETPDQTGDGIKHFCRYHMLLVKRGESRPEDLEEFERVIKSCFIKGYPGLMHRSPTKTGEQISKDAMVAVCAAGKALKSRLAWVVLDRGNFFRFACFKWFYPNLWPELFKTGIPMKMLFTKEFWKSWMGKNPEVVAHMQWAGLPPDHRPHPFRVFWQGVYFLISTVKNPSLVNLNEMMAESYSGGSWFLDFCIEIWKGRVAHQWPLGMKQVLAAEMEPGHAIIEYWKD